MRRIPWLLAVVLIGGSIASARPAQDDKEPPAQRPSLGKEPAGKPGEPPSLEGPHTFTTNDARKLLHVRTIYVEPIENSLSDKLLDGLAKMARFRIVTERRGADAVLSGTCFDSRRLKSVHSEVFITDRASGASIWQDSARRHYNPPPLSAAVDETATIILQHLAASIREAEAK